MKAAITTLSLCLALSDCSGHVDTSGHVIVDVEVVCSDAGFPALPTLPYPLAKVVRPAVEVGMVLGDDGGASDGGAE